MVLVPVGSHGDVHPFVRLGIRLKSRGHRVTVLTAEPFRMAVESNGLEFHSTLSADDYQAMTMHPDLWHPSKGLNVIFNQDLMRKMLPISYAAI
jgi:rhamnosyltransferase subunit B